MDGSGGESHRKRLSLSWFPVKLSESLERRAGVKEATNGWPGPVCDRRLGRRRKCLLHRC
jgi:hypothetical protein